MVYRNIPLRLHMSFIREINRKNKDGTVATYYAEVESDRINGKVVQKYVGYLGKSLNSKTEIEPEEILKYVSRLLQIFKIIS